MAQSFQTLAELAAHGFDTLIDVRSPSEFAEDHIPGAINLPVLDDAERAQVGTIYKQQSSFTARKMGAALVARNAAAHLEGALAGHEGGWRPLVYCWRGGQRSGSFTTILQQVGWRAEVIDGGYRTYRRLVSAAMHDVPLGHRLVVLDGNTGTAKTDILAHVAAQGGQVVDLEGLAAHRGSVFGAMPGGQPSQKAFEGRLAMAFEALDPACPVLVEAESSKIGNLAVPPSVWAAMRAAPRIQISAPLAARAEYLTRAYADITTDPDRLEATLDALIGFHGHEVVDRWCAMAKAGQMATLAAELMDLHYDPRYAKSRGRTDFDSLGEVQTAALGEADLARMATQILGLIA